MINLLYKVTLANSKDSDEMLHNAAFHQCLHCLLRQKRSSEKDIDMEIRIFNP